MEIVIPTFTSNSTQQSKIFANTTQDKKSVLGTW